jgi:hypothetical protein
VPTSSVGASSLRKALGLALLGAAFITAFAAGWRTRRRPQRTRATESGAIDPFLFWDSRLLQLATSTLRRIVGRI